MSGAGTGLDMDEAAIIRRQTEKIEASGVLGRSRSYSKLLDYLVARSLEGRTPKELEIAVEVFGRDASFDPSQDSMVRVYAHNLRQKIQQFYADAGRDEARQITVPRGEYRVALAPPAPVASETAPAPRRGWSRPKIAAVAVLLLSVGFLLGVTLRAVEMDSPAQSKYASVAASPIWKPLLDDDLPIMVVVGDYYIFGELDSKGHVARLVREFSINSSKDLDNYLMYKPDLQSKYVDLDLTYLASSTAFALRDLLRVLYTSDKPVRMASMSELSVSDLKSNHIVYVGYISGLDKLLDFVFAGSSLSVGNTYDELVDKKTGTTYTSEAGWPVDYRNYRDYGLFSTFPGPTNNQFVIVAGTRDAGLMQSAQAVTDPKDIEAAEKAMPERGAGNPPAFELLYEVMGFNRSNLDARIVHSAPLDYAKIWGGRPLTESPPKDVSKQVRPPQAAKPSAKP